MKRKTGIALLIGVLAVSGFEVFKRLRPTDEKRINDMLLALADTASYEAGGGNFSQLARAAGLADFFTGDAVVDFAAARWPVTVNGREEIRSGTLRAQRQYKSLAVSFTGPVTEVQGIHARSRVTSLVRTASEPEPYLVLLAFEFIKTNRSWKVRRVKATDDFNPPRTN